MLLTGSQFPLKEVFWDPSAQHMMYVTEPAQMVLLEQSEHAGCFGMI